MTNHPSRNRRSRLRKCAEGASFHEGERVAVFNQTFSGCPIFEGWATILGAGEVEDQYVVVFPKGDGSISGREFVQRFVYPGEGQEDPIGYTKKMQAEFVAQTGYDGPTLIRS